MGLDISNAPGLIPHQKKQALDTNYLSFNGGTGAGDSADGRHTYRNKTGAAWPAYCAEPVSFCRSESLVLCDIIYPAITTICL